MNLNSHKTLINTQFNNMPHQIVYKFINLFRFPINFFNSEKFQRNLQFIRYVGFFRIIRNCTWIPNTEI